MYAEYDEWLKEVESGIRERIFCNVTWNVKNGNMKVEISVFGTVVAHEVNVADLRELYNKGKILMVLRGTFVIAPNLNGWS